MAYAQAVVLWSPETGGEAWRPTTLRRLGKDEAFLEEAVAATPRLLGLESRRSGVGGPFRAFRQVALSTPSGRGVYPDVAFLTGSGHVVVVEAKLADNPELRDRAVIAQILDYASSFAALSDEGLLALFRGGSAAETWADLVRELFPDDGRPDELADVLRGRATNGELNLVIACDRVPPGLPEVVRGVAAQKAFGFELDLVEVVPYVRSEAEPGPILFVPSTRLSTEIVARTAVTVTYRQGDAEPAVSVQTTSLEEIERKVEAARQGATASRVWSEAEVEEAFVRDGDPNRLALLRLAKESNAGGPVVSPAPKQNATFGVFVKGRLETGTPAERMLFACTLGWPKVTIYLSAVEALAGPEVREEFRRRLKSTFGEAFNAEQKEPGIPAPALAEKAVELRELVRWVQAQAAARASPPGSGARAATP